ncbi:hypothetical protein Pyn_23836 [Prunus yedoensis var. nudiflora]|uniref:Uncharacterized protein n=1 Tax=Prunus yedoensis var. nudiflora TaxID=2094558 RepID=A0A314Z1M3_PRUYE|nr:hypothetical protein Pyn_23836 [Prunus yedoensis var. nudiflora]
MGGGGGRNGRAADGGWVWRRLWEERESEGLGRFLYRVVLEASTLGTTLSTNSLIEVEPANTTGPTLY